MSQSIESYEREQDRLEAQADEEERLRTVEAPVNPDIPFEVDDAVYPSLCPECEGRTFTLPDMRECVLCEGTGEA